MLEFRDVSFCYGQDSADAVSVLKGINFALAAGEHVALVGPNGSGKSTVAALAQGLLLPSAGAVMVDGRCVTAPCANDVGVVGQDAQAQFVEPRVVDEALFSLAQANVSESHAKKQVYSALELCGLMHKRDALVWQLSGGEKVRLALAGVLVCQPRYIILDETSAHLDEKATSDLYELVERLCKQGIGVLSITHSAQDASRAHKIILLRAGRVVWKHAVAEVFNNPALLHEAGLDPYDVTPFVNVGIRQDAHVALKAQSLSYQYPETASPVIEEVSFTCKEGSLTLIEGPMGAGKTTLALILAGLLQPTAGRVMYGSAQAGVESQKSKLPLAGFAFQRPQNMLFASTVLEDVATAPLCAGCSQEAAFARAREALNFCGVDPKLWDKNPYELSGGQKRLVALAGVFARKAPVYILDEPFAGLDALAVRHLVEVMAQLMAQGTAFVVVAHKASWLHGVSQQVELKATAPKQVESQTAVWQQAKIHTEPSPLRRVSAGIKIGGLLLLCVATFAAHTPFAAAVLTAVFVAGLVAARINLRSLVRLLKPCTIIAVFMICSQSVVLGAPFAPFVSFSAEGFIRALVALARLVLIVGFLGMVMSTTTLREASDTLTKIIAPFLKTNAQKQKARLALSLTLCFIPQIYQEYQRIYYAQRARGINFSTGGLLRRARNYAALLVPLTLATFERSDELAHALMVRMSYSDRQGQQEGEAHHA